MRTLIVGEAPSRASDPSRPLSGRCGERLAALCGLAALGDAFDLANVFDAWPGADGAKGARFDLAAARRRADAMPIAGRRVVALGRRVGRALGTRADYFEPRAVRDGAVVTVVPHPSGVNRWYNDPENAARMARFMRQLLGDEGERHDAA